MQDFISMHPDVAIVLVKWLVSLLGFCALSFIALFVYIFKQLRITVKDLSESLDSLKSLVGEISGSLRELWTEHRLMSTQHCDQCSANERRH